MNREMPTLLAASYSSNTVEANNWQDLSSRRISSQSSDLLNQIRQHQSDATTSPKPQEPTMTAARIVKVFIADPNENIALDKRVLHTGSEQLTDLTDQELFFEVPIAEMLTKHNAERLKTIDKAQAAKFGRDIFLEPAKIRDLKMVVVTVATF